MIRLPFLVAGLVTVMLIASFGPAVEAAQSGTAQAAPRQRGMHDSTSMRRQMADMSAADERLEALIKDMDAAVGESKIAAMAAVVRELVEQQKAMRRRMADMHQHMDARQEATRPATPVPQEHQHDAVD
jgi:hypothetical protein